MQVHEVFAVSGKALGLGQGACACATIPIALAFLHTPSVTSHNCSWQFYATWCQGCKALFPHMAELAAQRPDIKFLLIEGEENKVGLWPSVHTHVLHLHHSYAAVGAKVPPNPWSGHIFFFLFPTAGAEPQAGRDRPAHCAAVLRQRGPRRADAGAPCWAPHGLGCPVLQACIASRLWLT